VAAPEATGAVEVAPEVELERLTQKWASTEEADYFSVLGLPRTAGTEEVQRAHARLAAEFDPLRYVGHPDPEVPARAARLQTLLDEAAQALSDERLRHAYARSLVDVEGASRAT
jgi:DnaJ-class molecular chaperone